MNAHGVFVWSAYLLMLAVMGAELWVLWRRHGRRQHRDRN